MTDNSILQAGRALMFFDGYRPRGGEQHATVVEFLEERLGMAYAAQVRLFDQMRRKRHRVIYEVAGLVSKREAEQAIAFAREFVEKITEIITAQSRLGI
ncbi:MAG TPA: HEPN domain-containing protein [Anaerolineales bacterium]|nr:HEPN domain-containing protein [Anaerolineales bacterium]